MNSAFMWGSALLEHLYQKKSLQTFANSKSPLPFLEGPVMCSNPCAFQKAVLVYFKWDEMQ